MSDVEEALRSLANTLAEAEETSGLDLGTEDDEELARVLEEVWSRSPRGRLAAWRRIARVVRLREMIAAAQMAKSLSASLQAAQKPRPKRRGWLAAYWPWWETPGRSA